MRRIFGAALLLGAFAPAFASAQSVDATIAEVQSLLAQITQLQLQLQQTQTGTPSTPATNPAPGAPPSGGGVCLAFTHTLSRGNSGADVLALQNFLIAQGFLSADSATGFFGAHTEAAVQQFQASKNIVSSGAPGTTGYGLVGSRTRAALQQNCAPTPVPLPTCPLAPVPDTPCLGTWSAITDTNGCTHSWQCSVPLSAVQSSCTNTVALTCPGGARDQVGANCTHTCVAN